MGDANFQGLTVTFNDWITAVQQSTVHGTITNDTPTTTTNAAVNLVAGASMIINDAGAFFNKGASVGVGAKDPAVASINADSDRARIFILLHALAHLSEASGFQHDADPKLTAAANQHRGNENNDKVWDNCKKTIQRFSNKTLR